MLSDLISVRAVVFTLLGVFIALGLVGAGYALAGWWRYRPTKWEREIEKARRKGPTEYDRMQAALARITEPDPEPADLYEDPIARALILTAAGDLRKGTPPLRIDPQDEMREWVRRWVRREVSAQQLHGELTRMFAAHPELLDVRLPPAVAKLLEEARARRRDQGPGDMSEWEVEGKRLYGPTWETPDGDI